VCHLPEWLKSDFFPNGMDYVTYPFSSTFTREQMAISVRPGYETVARRMEIEANENELVAPAL